MKLADMLGIDKSHVAAIGDYYNDWDMLKNSRDFPPVQVKLLHLYTIFVNLRLAIATRAALPICLNILCPARLKKILRKKINKNVGNLMLTIGAHLSASKGYTAMLKQAVEIGANTFQFFYT